MVVANAVAALAEIQDQSGRNVFRVDSDSVNKLLRAINECTEWGQVSWGPCTSPVSLWRLPGAGCVSLGE